MKYFNQNIQKIKVKTAESYIQSETKKLKNIKRKEITMQNGEKISLTKKR